MQLSVVAAIIVVCALLGYTAAGLVVERAPCASPLPTSHSESARTVVLASDVVQEVRTVQKQSAAPAGIKTAEPAPAYDGICDLLNSTKFEHMRLIFTRKVNSTEACMRACIEDSGCSFFTFVKPRDCRIGASASKPTLDPRHMHTSGNCVARCAAGASGVSELASDKPAHACTLQSDMWYEGKSYESVIAVRDADKSAACSGKTRSPDLCAARCEKYKGKGCRYFNWRKADSACHLFTDRSTKHNGPDGKAHVAGACNGG
ncbi:hypothetical protein DIPPA_25795 [Diplonema papillatum]|nr:hypothetical protein DIPPA_25795 [Diplonema papillatum]